MLPPAGTHSPGGRVTGGWGVEYVHTCCGIQKMAWENYEPSQARWRDPEVGVMVTSSDYGEKKRLILFLPVLGQSRLCH